MQTWWWRHFVLYTFKISVPEKLMVATVLHHLNKKQIELCIYIFLYLYKHIRSWWQPYFVINIWNCFILDTLFFLDFTFSPSLKRPQYCKYVNKMKYMYIYNMFWGDVPCGFGPNLIAQTWSKKSMNLGTAIALDFAAHVQCEPKWIQWHDASRNLCLALTSRYLLNGS